MITIGFIACAASDSSCQQGCWCGSI